MKASSLSIPSSAGGSAAPTSNSKVPQRPGAPSHSEVHEHSRDLLHVFVLGPNCALDDAQPRASGRLRPACANDASSSGSEYLCICHCVEFCDGKGAVAAAHDVPGFGHDEVRLEQQGATGE